MNPGSRYSIVVHSIDPKDLPSSLTCLVDLVDLLDDDDPTKAIWPMPQSDVSVKIETLEKSGVLQIIYQRGAMDTTLKLTGSSKILTFIRSGNFYHEQVECLPSSYNGNVVFKLPSPIDSLSRGSCLQDMERA